MLSRGELRSRPVPVFEPGTRHRRDPSPRWSCRIASFRLWPLAIIPQNHNVRRQTSGVNRQNSAHTSQKKKGVALPLSRPAQRPTPLGTASHIMLLLCIPRWPLFRWAPGTRSALTGRRLAALFPVGRDAVKARDALLGQYPLGQPRGVRRRGYSPGHRPRDAHSVETTPDV